MNRSNTPDENVQRFVPQATPQEAMNKLDELRWELGNVANALAQIERQLEPVEEEFSKLIDDFELGLYTRSIEDDDFKLPAEKLRAKMAVRAVPPEIYGKRTALVNARDRASKRIGTLKIEVEAQRSILSALKEEAQASGAALRRVA